MKTISFLFCFLVFSLSSIQALDLWQIASEKTVDEHFLCYSARITAVDDHSLKISLFNQKNETDRHVLELTSSTQCNEIFYTGDAATIFIDSRNPKNAYIAPHFNQTTYMHAVPCQTNYHRKPRLNASNGSFHPNSLIIQSEEHDFETYYIPDSCNKILQYCIDNAHYFVTTAKIDQPFYEVRNWEDIDYRDFRSYTVTISVTVENSFFYNGTFTEQIMWHTSKRIADPDVITFPIIQKLIHWSFEDDILIFIHKDYPHIQWIVNANQNSGFCLQAGRVIDFKEQFLPVLASV